MHKLHFAICMLAATVSPVAQSSIFDELESLEGKTVIYAGEFESVDCPPMGKYDCTTWPMTMLKTRRESEVCLGIEKYVKCSYKCRGLIAVGDDKTPKVFVFSDFGSEATSFGFQRYRCPSLF